MDWSQFMRLNQNQVMQGHVQQAPGSHIGKCTQRHIQTHTHVNTRNPGQKHTNI